MLRLALLDDHHAVLAGLRRLIEAQADMIVIAAAPTVGELSHQLGGTARTCWCSTTTSLAVTVSCIACG